jgi:hypothetical protein
MATFNLLKKGDVKNFAAFKKGMKNHNYLRQIMLILLPYYFQSFKSDPYRYVLKPYL